MRRPRLVTEQVRALTPKQKETALLALALRVNEDDWRRVMDLAAELHPAQERAS